MPKEKSPKKEVKIEESLFILTKQPENITEEDITFYRERRICLACKKDLARINYLCPKCNALYCIECARKLSKLNKNCWVCKEPFEVINPINE